MRTFLAPSPSNNILPVRLLGTSVSYSSARCAPIRALDPFFFQASDPATDAFFWFSFLSVPADLAQDRVCQILVSWPYRKGFLGREEPVDTPAPEERVAWMKRVTEGWVEPFRGIVADIPEGTEVKSLALEDWVPAEGGFDSRGGRVTLIGDAAHAMTMCMSSLLCGLRYVANCYCPFSPRRGCQPRYRGCGVPRPRAVC